MNEPLKTILLPNGKNAVEWTTREKPSVNYWYLCKDSDTDYWKITKDYHSRKRNKRIIRLSNTITGIFFIVVILSRRYAKLSAIIRTGW